ncbi:MAG: hypothetical protein ACFCVK_14630 [Acidimicrobiales bacterium]
MRKIDGDLHIVAEQPRIRYYPADLEQLQRSVELARDADPPVEGRAIGSHWGISHCGVTRGTMIETATPVHEAGGDQTAPRLNRQLFTVVPDCLSSQALAFFQRQDVTAFDPTAPPDFTENYLFHVEAGIRIHELYALMDGDDGARPGSLADWIRRNPNHDFPDRDYAGPWAIETLGGAGGQTLMGAVATGTHGGDVKAGPLADAVVALHLIDGRGRHHWIERTQIRPGTIPLPLTDPGKLDTAYPGIEHHADDDLLDAAVIACGRMGVIYSVVVRAVRQFALREERSSNHDWHHWRTNLVGSPVLSNHFAQLVINPYGTFWHADSHTCYLTTRTVEPLAVAGDPPLGRLERGTNPGTGKPLGKRTNFSSRACASDHWLRDEIDHQLEIVRDARDAALVTWAAAAAVIVFPLTPEPLRQAAIQTQNAAAGTIAITTGLIDAIGRLVMALVPLGTFGDTLATAMNFCIDFQDPLLGIDPLLPLMRAMIGSGFDGDQEADPDDPHTPAISYATMDIHDYTNIGCNKPGDSVEVFFEVGPGLITFIDRILDRVDDLYEGGITGEPGGFGGYIALRFMTRSPAFLAMQRWPLTCSVEVGGLSRVDGSDAYIARVHDDALELGGVIHWGQKNECTQADIESVFGSGPGTALHRWRAALSELTDHGSDALFSTPFTRQRGLEITEPRISALSSVRRVAPKGEVAQVSWDATMNPPGTTAILEVGSGVGPSVRYPVDLQGTMGVTFPGTRFPVRLELDRELNGNHYGASREIELRGYDRGDEWVFRFETQRFQFQGAERWLVDMNMEADSISPALLVSEVRVAVGGVPAWIIRHQDGGDHRVTAAAPAVAFAAPVRFARSWRIFSEAPAQGTSAPIELRFRITF